MDIRKLARQEIFDFQDTLVSNPEFTKLSSKLLSNAASDLDLDYVNLLIKLGVVPEKELLHSLAFKYGQEMTIHGEQVLAVVSVLLLAGADPVASDKVHGSPIDICKTFGAKKLEKLLLQYA